MKPFLIGVAGPSGAGKSELSRLIAARLPGPTALISLDSYYLPLSHLPLAERVKCNFDHPASLDWELIRSDLDRLRRGEAIEEPLYRFDLYSRDAETRRVEPAEFVIIEGLFALYDERVRLRLDARLFVIAPDEICLDRRLARDMRERGRTRDSVLRQYATTVRPMAALYVLPSEQQADLVLSGVEPLERSWTLCRNFILQAAGRSGVMNETAGNPSANFHHAAATA